LKKFFFEKKNFVCRKKILFANFYFAFFIFFFVFFLIFFYFFLFLTQIHFLTQNKRTRITLIIKAFIMSQTAEKLNEINGLISFSFFFKKNLNSQKNAIFF